MEIPPAEVIDRMSIVKLKIERIGELHLQKEFEELQKAVEEFEEKGIKINAEWFEELYEINSLIWDQEFIVRQIADKLVGDESLLNINKEYESMGKRYLEVGKLMHKRVEIKNKISDETGQGFKEIKKDHCAA